MNYNFTDRVRRTLAVAREAALRRRHLCVDTEHILLGLLRDPESVAVAVLRNLGCAPEQVWERIGEPVHEEEASIALGDLPYTASAKSALELAMAAARELNHSYVGTEHLLLGLLREEKGVAARVLNQLGVTTERSWAEVIRLIGRGERRPEMSERGIVRKLRDLVSPSHPEANRSAHFAVEIDDASAVSIYEQIVAQVQEAVATRRLRAGERLPTVRQLADELDIAPGTVARAYSELERLGVVVTEGARGTRVADRPRQPLGNEERPETLVGLLRPVAVAAFHLGATAPELRAALDAAMQGIYETPPPA